MNAHSAAAKSLNSLIDAADVLLTLQSADQAWLAAVAFVDRMGGNALNVCEIDAASGVPIWFRSSMKSAWLEDYFAQEFAAFDPVIIAACNGQQLTRMHNGRVRGFDEASARVDAYCDQIVSAGYHTLDFHAFTAEKSSNIKGLSFSHVDHGNLANAQEKLLCAMIASVVYAPTHKNSPGATPLLANALSARERDVLRYLAMGLRNDAIAFKLGIAEITVRTHINSARQKLGAATREQAIVLALRSGQLAL